ncbi:glycosyltransferase family 61 protein [Kaistella polysaccharea]|uniref:glycosyltransferase family 61 protein n=1 Tax=Kaistella polysaccharea TaxID=2878534 RepID=UPI001CF4C5E5|nr:glycosyltransferase family 61 protein [Kaistella polysaccharea]
MFKLIKKKASLIIRSKEGLNNYFYTYLKIAILNIFQAEKYVVLKIKNIHEILPTEKLKEGYSYKSSTQNNIDVIIPDLNLYMLKDALINSRSSAIVANSYLFYEPINKNERFNEGFIQYHNTKNAVLKIGNPIEISEGFFLAGNGSFNWYHWLIEILPKIIFYKKEYSVNILVDHSCKEIKSMADSLAVFCENLNINIIYLDPERTYKVRKLFFINEVNKYMFNALDLNAVAFPLYYYRKESLLNVGDLLKSKYHFENKSAIKIFLERRETHRIPQNQNEVVELLKQYDFTAVDLSTLNITEQINTINNSKYIVGTSGAAFTNIIFCNPSSTVLIFTPDNYDNHKLFGEMAALLDIKLNYLYYENDSGDHEQSNFRIDLNALKLKLENIE